LSTRRSGKCSIMETLGSRAGAGKDRYDNYPSGWLKLRPCARMFRCLRPRRHRTASGHSMTDTPALAIDNLRKVYGNGTVAPKGLPLTVDQADFFALLRPNGAGKSTTIGIITSLVNPGGGDARVFGVSIHADRMAAMRLIGLVPQETNFHQSEKPFDISV